MITTIKLLGIPTLGMLRRLSPNLDLLLTMMVLSISMMAMIEGSISPN